MSSPASPSGPTRCGETPRASAPSRFSTASAWRHGRTCRPASSPISTRNGSSWRAPWRSNRELLLLDEWLAGLNPRELGIGIELVQSLRQDGLTIVLVEHVMDAIRSLCDRCVVMNAGRKIADGPPAAVLADEAVITAYLGAAAHA